MDNPWRIDFGRHRGKLYSEVPTSYLRWMVSEEHSKSKLAKEELDRRKQLSLVGAWTEPKN